VSSTHAGGAGLVSTKVQYGLWHDWWFLGVRRRTVALSTMIAITPQLLSPLRTCQLGLCWGVVVDGVGHVGHCHAVDKQARHACVGVHEHECTPPILISDDGCLVDAPFFIAVCRTFTSSFYHWAVNFLTCTQQLCVQTSWCFSSCCAVLACRFCWRSDTAVLY
jgi:hypothetical protein